MNSGDLDFASQTMRERLYRRLHKVVKETENRELGSAQLDVCKAQALANERNMREREVASDW
jgi:hypothetical protein